ncbi:hypothetical protein FE257_006677 [Aspergillus nanangensis]|uniref:Myb-like domain-containing protein n=1 Tax=Aspergillus nanangensis TaxID=2582783 RepID=A0AAD4CQP9_ASPNN|nr:hypothetical protein FE257_006677 [Aspergillus nanangensis]
MLPVFHADNFKSWTPPSRTRCPSSKPPWPHEHAPPTKPSSTKFLQPFLPQALPLPKHQLPARPPAEVCVHASAVIPSVTSEGPQSKSQKPSRLHFDTTTTTSAHVQHTEPPGQFPGNRTSSSTTSDLAPSRDFHGDFDASADAPFCSDDASQYISSPSVSSSDESWQELLQLADKQSGIPIDPMILTNNGPWETEDERQHIHADNDAFISGTTCLYPDPPPLLRDVPARYQHFSTYPWVQEQNKSSCSAGPLSNQSRPQVSADNNNSETQIRASGNLVEVPNSGPQPKPRKRKSQESHGPPQPRKRARNSAAIVSAKNSFSSLHSHFTSVSVDERLQFLSWLFEDALPRCLSQSDEEAPERIARPTRHLARSNDSAEPHGNSRKGMPWSSEEVDLLLRLRRDEKRPWSEVTRLFSDQFPGRNQGSIQVFWSTNLKSREH